MKRPRKLVTIHDVAEAAGVSVSTVSRVLNQKDDVAADTYSKVQQVIKTMGYASSLAARGMRSRRIKVIGLVIPDVASPYMTEVLRGVNKAIVELDYDLLIYTSGDIHKYENTNKERDYVVFLNGGIADGVIVVTPVTSTFQTNFPVVAIDPNSPDCPGIIATNRVGALEAMKYLTNLGHRRIGFITGRLDLISARRRLEGYKDGLALAGIPLDDSLIQIGDYLCDTAISCTKNLLSLDDPPTAIFASNDMSAMGVYQAAHELGVQIPEKLSVIGFDNLKESSYLQPTLTTVDQFIQVMGVLAVEKIVKLVNGETLENTLHKIQTQLVVRNSCKYMG